MRCTFWFPHPDSEDHEYMTLGDFTPFTVGDGANTTKVANTLCETGKLNPNRGQAMYSRAEARDSRHRRQVRTNPFG